MKTESCRQTAGNLCLSASSLLLIQFRVTFHHGDHTETQTLLQHSQQKTNQRFNQNACLWTMWGSWSVQETYRGTERPQVTSSSWSSSANHSMRHQSTDQSKRCFKITGQWYHRDKQTNQIKQQLSRSGCCCLWCLIPQRLRFNFRLSY